MHKDKRNWKCWFGFHQYEVIKETPIQYVARSGSLPYRLTTKYVLQCRYCGKMKGWEI